MGHSVYVASLEAETGKSMVALGLIEALAVGGRVGVFRPVVRSRTEPDTVLQVLLGRAGTLEYEDALGVTYAELHADPDAAMSRIVERHRVLARQVDALVVVGSDYTGVSDPAEIDVNARIAADLGASMVLVLRAVGRRADGIAEAVRLAVDEVHSHHARVAAVVVNRVPEAELDAWDAALAELDLPSWTLPEVDVLAAPTVGEVVDALGGALLSGDPELLGREARGLLLAGMNVPHVLERLAEGQLVIAPSDRPELLVALVAAHAADSFPSLAGVVLNGGYALPDPVARLVGGVEQRLPICTAPHGSYETARIASQTRGVLTPTTQRKQDVAGATFRRRVPVAELLDLVRVDGARTVTPLMFEADLFERARADRRHVVLPEGDDDRVLRAASTLLARDVAELTVLGDEGAVRSRAAGLGLDLDRARVLSTQDPELVERFAQEYAKARAHKGMTVERAREVVTDVSYFGTMMVHLDLADGMVSGAAHTTAHTIRPALEVIGTQDGVGVVSSVFLMLLQDRVLVYGDCAVVPDPDATQLADIAISSARTASVFGVEPRVAMLSYSTGTSGVGADVEKVREATALVREREPGLAVEGPLQYDAAVDAAVARAKLPDSEVAGRATVLVFPDLNTGNTTYKAVQRSSGAVAVGPVLQGLRRPVNDLSRGAGVHDIVSTVAITAVQAAELAEQPEMDHPAREAG